MFSDPKWYQIFPWPDSKLHTIFEYNKKGTIGVEPTGYSLKPSKNIFETLHDPN